MGKGEIKWQYRTNKEAYEVVCRIYYKLQSQKRNASKIELTRIGTLIFDLTRRETSIIQRAADLIEERFRMREKGGGFIRSGRVRERSPKDGKII